MKYVLTVLTLSLFLWGCGKKGETIGQAEGRALLLSEDTHFIGVPGYNIFIGKLDEAPEQPYKWTMKNVRLNRIENGELIQRTRADHGEVKYFPKEKRYEFRLFDTKGSVRSDKLSMIFGGSDDDSQSANNDVVETPDGGTEWMPWSAGEIILPIDLADMEKSVRPKPMK